MARKQRAKSHYGIYHVMLRGINKQDIFLDDNDFDSMVKALDEARFNRDKDGNVLPEHRYTLYAYCILHNHLHLLIKEGTEQISDTMKKIQDRFVAIYNRKYDRVGHIFQDRFASEPVDDVEYFHQLIRYIHRNPVKANEALRPEDYKYSSWREYIASKSYIIKGSDPLMMQDSELRESHETEVILNGMRSICTTKSVIKRFGYDALMDWVNQNVDDKCMDMDSFAQPMPETEVWERLKEISQVESVEYFKQLSPEFQVQYISQLISEGASLRQASRLSSLSYRALWNRFHPEEYQASLEQSRRLRKEKREQKKKDASSKGQTP